MTTRQDDDLIWETDRRLTLMEWSPASTGVLLHTDPHDRAAGRLVLRFTGAVAVCLGRHLHGARIIVGRAVPDAVTAVLGRAPGPGENLYTISSGAVSGWIVADGAHGLQHDVDSYEALSFASRAASSHALFSHGTPS